MDYIETSFILWLHLSYLVLIINGIIENNILVKNQEGIIF